MFPGAIRILGVDPGLRRTGWGIITHAGTRLGFVASGRIETDESASLAVRLLAIHAGLEKVIAEFGPHEAAAESTFVNKDAAATLKLGHARGVALLAAARAGLPIGEYAPNLVKKTIVGAGHGDKRQIRVMVNLLLPDATPNTEDAADALAIAITHAHHRSARLFATTAQRPQRAWPDAGAPPPRSRARP